MSNGSANYIARVPALVMPRQLCSYIQPPNLPPSMDKAKDQKRTLRLRDNKRRHRQRHKEYVADLERRLAETREGGVCATKEVQAAAQRVSWENWRLRQILHGQGLDNDAINSLIYNDARTSRVSQSAITEARRRTPQNDEVIKKPCDPIAENKEYIPTQSNSNLSEKATIQNIVPSSQTACTAQTSQNVASTPPCKLLTILAGNPNADITQVPAAADEQEECEGPGGVECLQARKMLMRFATSEDKLDEIASALEKGCVKNGAGRGCWVKNDVIWKVLDRCCE